MPLVLRITLILISLFFILFVVKKVNEGKLQTQFSLVWLFIAAVIIVIAIFPQIMFFAAGLLRIEASSNLVYLLGIITLLFLMVNLSIKMSKYDNDIRNLVQDFGIYSFLKEQEEKNEN
ncbi:MAG: DUF2304 domain-containing protein [Clostridia bacterium]|nr:DUF2304 domain-containing protein [Clostridia bacterium]